MTPLTVASATDTGRRRSVNEDSLLASPPLFVIADGMGGHEAGDVASTAVVEAFTALLDRGALTVDAVTACIDDAKRSVGAKGEDTGRVLGTTLIGAAVTVEGGADYWLIFNIGDSRAYRYARGCLTQISVDHSVVQELLDAGSIDGEEARTHPDRNVITRSIGAGGGDVDYWLLPVEPGERLLLCSDGLTSEVPDSRIAGLLERAADPATAARTLLDAALEAGGRDNVSVIVIDVPGATEVEATRPPMDGAVDDSTTPRAALPLVTEPPGGDDA